ncbi:hypothetical protein BVE84_06345 [Streptococcus azizii]|uniref:DUF1310 domain-containing protein n=1 Tax=Streptococcus azizii TaxID=1579424 RepID=A0AB36JLU4_9STRE|nr:MULTISPECIES: hypothetical protein [Streptococcus]MBF0776865.1 hypothetical protein [Streptococcus sp. 19428wD3_AN2]ONK27063.1 hypothetical protein BVE86_05710 [Streptococcus azizii]ONK28416.1 hypothetical protein BVE85_04570 [Streptococcus azizii]ONK28496.1 hypothetical protein BVE84_06345 [Streptococcus azizii]TFU82222.1 hypothetical protein E4T83_08940 [Streptococcus sp. AN2]
MKKKALILLIILGGLLMVFSINNQRQKTAEEERNRQYEISLAKALKNSYRDIKEIQISKPHYAKPPGSWSCSVTLTFSDGEIVQYGMGHSLSDTINRSGVVTTAESEILSSHFGSTEGNVRVIFSDGRESIE